MNQVSGTDPEQLDPAAGWAPPGRRRVLQLVLATLWFIDGVLQLQPFMFSRSFGSLMLGPTAQGNPGVIARPITHVTTSIANHSVPADAAFIVIQLGLAVLIANRRTVKLGLAASVVWSLGVWWIGEGLGGVLTGTASPLTGAPGAVIIYAALAILLWPAEDEGISFTAERPVGRLAARAIWVLLWGVLAGLALFASIARHPRQILSGIDSGEPGWLVDVNRHVLSLVAAHGTLLAALSGAVLLAVAVSTFLPGPLARAFVVVAVAASLLLWVTGEDLGSLFTGSATDVNSGPLLALFAIAYWPLRRASLPTPVPHLAEAVAP
ncbi:MAG TPA: hypothetical protein VEJ21_03145 [Acidimicrobiales bacterium]|nr:hypothetical protein [Acidimicrobiales bacterium]